MKTRHRPPSAAATEQANRIRPRFGSSCLLRVPAGSVDDGTRPVLTLRARTITPVHGEGDIGGPGPPSPRSVGRYHAEDDAPLTAARRNARRQCSSVAPREALPDSGTQARTSLPNAKECAKEWMSWPAPVARTSDGRAWVDLRCQAWTTADDGAALDCSIQRHSTL